MYSLPFLTSVNFLIFRIFKNLFIGIQAGGCSPPQILGNSHFLGSKRKFGQSQFLKMFPCFFISLKRQIFFILIWKNPEVSVIIQLVSLETLTVVSNTWWIFGYRDGYHLLIYIFIVFYCWALYCTALTGMGSFQSWID